MLLNAFGLLQARHMVEDELAIVVDKVTRGSTLTFWSTSKAKRFASFDDAQRYLAWH